MKKYVEIFVCYRCLFVMGDIIIGEWEIFGAEVFLRYSRFFVISDFVIGGVECTYLIKVKLLITNEKKAYGVSQS